LAACEESLREQEAMVNFVPERDMPRNEENETLPKEHKETYSKYFWCDLIQDSFDKRGKYHLQRNKSIMHKF
jgi:hypothetical protein